MTLTFILVKNEKIQATFLNHELRLKIFGHSINGEKKSLAIYKMTTSENQAASNHALIENTVKK